MITLDKVIFEKIVQLCRLFDRSCMFGKGYLSGVVTKLNCGNRHKAATIHLLGTMCEGEAHGNFDLRTMPADSNLLNSALAISNFSGLRGGGFCKNGGGVATCVDVMLDPMVRCQLHIPGAQNRGEFLQ